jgi:hypothetical protein
VAKIDADPLRTILTTKISSAYRTYTTKVNMECSQDALGAYLSVIYVKVSEGWDILQSGWECDWELA